MFERSRPWRQLLVVLALVSAAVWLVRCSAAYKDPSTAAGQQAIIDQVNNDLTSGNCEAALNLLRPIVSSPASNNTYLMLFASAYACKAGVNVASIIGSLNNSGGSDIWSTLVKADPSNGADGHLEALDQAVLILFATAAPSGVENASSRSNDANVYMVFLEAMTIATVISPAGLADRTTGHKTVSIAGDVNVSDECHVQVAVAEIRDSLNYVQVGSGLNTVSSNINTVCNSVPGGCPTNQDYGVCLGSAALQLDGQAMLVAIDAIWQ